MSRAEHWIAFHHRRGQARLDLLAMPGDFGVDAGDPAQLARGQESVMVGAMPVEWTPGSSSPKTWAQRRHPWCSRRWSATPEEAQPAAPVAVARCGNQHVGGG